MGLRLYVMYRNNEIIKNTFVNKDAKTKFIWIEM